MISGRAATSFTSKIKKAQTTRPHLSLYMAQASDGPLLKDLGGQIRKIPPVSG